MPIATLPHRSEAYPLAFLNTSNVPLEDVEMQVHLLGVDNFENNFPRLDKLSRMVIYPGHIPTDRRCQCYDRLDFAFLQSSDINTNQAEFRLQSSEAGLQHGIRRLTFL